MEFWNKYKMWIIIASILLVVGVILAIYFTAFSKGSKAGVGSVLATIPNPATDEPYTGDESRTIRSYATQVESEMHWYSIHSSTLWGDLSNETDRVLIGLSNQYKQDTGSDLVADISSTFTFNPFVVDNTTLVLNRLKTLLNS